MNSTHFTYTEYNEFCNNFATSFAVEHEIWWMEYANYGDGGLVETHVVVVHTPTYWLYQNNNAYVRDSREVCHFNVYSGLIRVQLEDKL